MHKRYLIAQLACFGDCLYATVVARQLKHEEPDCWITWAVLSKYKSILTNNPYIDNIWEINGDDYYGDGWYRFYDEAIEKKRKGVFDEMIVTQIPPTNWKNFDGTIRGSILKGANRPICVDLTPIVVLANEEIENVNSFAASNQLLEYEQVIVFEYKSGSGQSKVDERFALEVSKIITDKFQRCLIILSSNSPIVTNHPRIIDASYLSFRENAELIKYASLLIGCSSGITWLSTSTAGKKIPMIQLLDSDYYLFSGVSFDFEVNGFDTSGIIEMTLFNPQQVAEAVSMVFASDLLGAKEKFNQKYRPTVRHMLFALDKMIQTNSSIRQCWAFYRHYITTNRLRGNRLKVSPYFFLINMTRAYMRNSKLTLVKIVVRLLIRVKRI